MVAAAQSSGVPIPLLVLGGLALLLVAAGAAGLIARQLVERTPGRVPTPTAEDSLGDVVHALTISASTIRDIESELQEKQLLAERLAAEVARSEELLRLSRDEVTAVTEALRAEVDRGRRNELIASVIQNVVFFALGVAVNLVGQRAGWW